MDTLSQESLASFIDHTLLDPNANETQIKNLCDEAKLYGFKTVCIESKWLTLAQSQLRDCNVLPITVIDFPGGQSCPEKKHQETIEAIKNGAKEIDMVLNRQLLHDRDLTGLFHDISAVIKASDSIPVKVIIETSELSDEEKVIACAISSAAGAAFVKTSTGFTKSGATKGDIELMRRTVGPHLGVKASGGVRTLDAALKMIQAGASRIGSSSSCKIIDKLNGL
ncbi:deoxyribose-phosphate aldolase [Pseudobacteriovorax antillogorgiicola]|uniref:Deoxyribose-phosphate aldolase n=1 Tax=Pseudobacteriovorax antillogorgiicola TaxID=1513793 RepID=A0A1Y6CNH4_9BACT|nr:deoxyribose-phosphate aldolase [Pseudobacteriovorax antillogorgiicola]TCS47018.1 deoxyribose-phosphate aldolase [Pseudobacteriovorax antillogorgiicola]SMF65175.1 deoxyribose-phosphate aldolase [Pseudobacteriovorax antillogorgiicola]